MTDKQEPPLNMQEQGQFVISLCTTLRLSLNHRNWLQTVSAKKTYMLISIMH